MIDVVRTLIAVSGRDVEPDVQGEGTPHGEIDRQYLDSTAIRERAGLGAAVGPGAGPGAPPGSGIASRSKRLANLSTAGHSHLRGFLADDLGMPEPRIKRYALVPSAGEDGVRRFHLARVGLGVPARRGASRAPRWSRLACQSVRSASAVP